MRLTVGPLPSAVYWRRRAVVLGAVLLFVIVVVYSCTGPPGDPTASPDKKPSTSTSPTSSLLTPETSTPLPTNGNPTDDAPIDGSPAGPAVTGEPPAVPAPPPAVDGACTDAEILVTPVALPNRVVRGATVELRLQIKNISQRTCSRDVGADPQELFIKLGAEKIWSSDTCGTTKGQDVRSFTPGFVREYTVAWNGKDSSKCAGGVAAGDPPAAGEYQLFGRLGTKLSEPVKLTITG